MNNAVRLKEAAIAFHEVCGGQSLGRFLHLRIRKSQPNFTHLFRSKEAVYNLDICTQKGYILHSRSQGIGGSGPHTRPFNIDTDEIFIGKHLCQSYGILSPTTAQFKHNRTVIAEKLFMPLAFHVKSHIVRHRVRILKHMRITCHIGKFL